MKRTKLIKRIPIKRPVVYYAFLEIDQVEYRVPIALADYVVDLHQEMLSIRTRVKNEKKYPIGESLHAIPNIRIVK